MAYVGNEELLRRHNATLAHFEKNIANNNWQSHNSHHFDWWAFPFDPGTPTASQGDLYNVPVKDIMLLKKNAAFIKSLTRMATIQMWTYGWDMKKKAVLDVPSDELRQRQTACISHSVRLWKLGSALITFGLRDEFSSVQKFAQHLGAEDRDEKVSEALQRMTEKWQGLIVHN
jgi:hypothetical protein